jgi:hypothetical protein
VKRVVRSLVIVLLLAVLAPCETVLVTVANAIVAVANVGFWAWDGETVGYVWWPETMKCVRKIREIWAGKDVLPR